MQLGVPSILLCRVEAVGGKRQSGPSDDTLRMAWQGWEGVARRAPRLDCRVEDCPAPGRLVPIAPKDIAIDTIAVSGLGQRSLASKARKKPALARTANDIVAVGIAIIWSRRTNHQVSRFLRRRLRLCQIRGSPPAANGVFDRRQAQSKFCRSVLGGFNACGPTHGGRMSAFGLGFVRPAATNRQGDDHGKGGRSPVRIAQGSPLE